MDLFDYINNCDYCLYSLFFQIDFFQTIDDKLQDAKFRLREKVLPSKDVVLVEIDGRSIDKIGRWPWKRSVLAKLILKLKELGARTIALDMVFSEQSNEKDDKELAEAIKKAQNVVLGFFFRKDLKREEQEIALTNLPDYSIENLEILEEIKDIPIKNFPTAETNIPIISLSGVGKGFFSVFPDKDGILRRIQLTAGFDGYLMPSLSLAAVSHFLGEDISLVMDRFGIVSLNIGKRKIPVQNSGSMLINFYGKGHSINHVSAIDVLEGKVSTFSIHNKLVFVGVTEKAVGDFVPTPTDANFPGTEVHCTVASNILQNFYLRRDSTVYCIDLITILAVPIVITILSIISRNTFISLVGFILCGIVYFYVNYILFAHYNIRVATIYPLSEFILSFILLEVYRNFIIEQRTRYLKKAFSSYISKELVNQLLKCPEKLKLGGEKKIITILFLDIRDFTSISEKLSPEDLVSLLNNFFGPITDVILKNKGMLDKYIGDAIMALFNVPVDLENHAEAAVKSAVEILDRVDELNEKFSEIGLPVLKIGIGINTGEAVVGNLGTRERFDYTAIGDSVNLASRLEGLNKYYNSSVLLSEFTYKMLPEERFKIRFIGEVVVKGKNRPVKVYELMCSKSIHSKDLKFFEKGVEYLMNGNLNKAYNIFKEIYKKYGDGVSKCYMEKIKEIKDNPASVNNIIEITRFKTK